MSQHPSPPAVAGQAITAGALDRDLVIRRSAAAGEPGWLREQRLAAWEEFIRLPLPPDAGDEWRRTDLRPLDLASLRPLAAPARKPRLPAGLPALIGDPAAAAGLRLVVDGAAVQSRLAPELARAGIVFSSLDEAVATHPDLVRRHLYSVIGAAENKYRALNAALWQGGTFLYVPAGVEADLQLVTGTWLTPDGVAFLPRTLVVTGEGSRVTLVEVFGSTGGAVRTFAGHAVELVPGTAAQIRYVNLEDWSRNLWEVGVVRTVVGRDATVNTLMIGFGAGLVKTNVESRLAGEGATSEMLGVLFGDGAQHFDYHTLQEHAAPSTTSDLLYKGALKDKARSIFAGLIRADHGAQKTNAFQLNRNLILSEGARADSMPKLEIMANDLRCTHGASTSRLNDEQIFYLMSRGLPRETAVRMMVDGFFGEIFDRIPVDTVRQWLSGAIERKMAGYV
ncbi:MAG TPA: Fe-S cluster assembly protein SufD [bacterium]|nr:Fe-S cluster assembly protein SufD [bacterium]